MTASSHGRAQESAAGQFAVSSPRDHAKNAWGPFGNGCGGRHICLRLLDGGLPRLCDLPFVLCRLVEDWAVRVGSGTCMWNPGFTIQTISCRAASTGSSHCPAGELDSNRGCCSACVGL